MKGHLDCLEYMYDNQCPWSANVAKAAGTTGMVHVLSFIHEKMKKQREEPEPSPGCCGGIFSPGDKYKAKVEIEWHPDTSACAAKGGHLQCLAWLRREAEDWAESAEDGSLCAAAAEGGQLETLKWLREECGCEWNLYASDRAAQNGHLECLKHLRENGCQWTDHTVAWAAAGGHLECLKYLREHEKEWCEPTIMFADGQDNGLWNAEVLAKAAREATSSV